MSARAEAWRTQPLTKAGIATKKGPGASIAHEPFASRVRGATAAPLD